MLIEHELASWQGLTFASLYERCRENFLVSSEAALKSHLVMNVLINTPMM